MTETDDYTREQRENNSRAAGIGEQAVALGGRDDDATGAQDMVTDILHFVHSRWPETDMDALLEAALASFREEVEQAQEAEEPVITGGGKDDAPHNDRLE